MDLTMVDPLSSAANGAARAAASAVTSKLFGGAQGLRLGGREERREVYKRFQEAMVDAGTWASYLRLERVNSRWFMGRGRARELMGGFDVRTREMVKAYIELRIVANPEPLKAGEALMTSVGALMEVVNSGEEVYQEALDVTMGELRQFAEACRQDLWYLPQWWQFYRWVWLKARWKQIRGWFGRRRVGRQVPELR